LIVLALITNKGKFQLALVAKKCAGEPPHLWKRATKSTWEFDRMDSIIVTA